MDSGVVSFGTVRMAVIIPTVAILTIPPSGSAASNVPEVLAAALSQVFSTQAMLPGITDAMDIIATERKMKGERKGLFENQPSPTASTQAGSEAPGLWDAVRSQRMGSSSDKLEAMLSNVDNEGLRTIGYNERTPPEQWIQRDKRASGYDPSSNHVEGAGDLNNVVVTLIVVSGTASRDH